MSEVNRRDDRRCDDCRYWISIPSPYDAWLCSVCEIFRAEARIEKVKEVERKAGNR